MQCFESTKLQQKRFEHFPATVDGKGSRFRFLHFTWITLDTPFYVAFVLFYHGRDMKGKDWIISIPELGLCIYPAYVYALLSLRDRRRFLLFLFITLVGMMLPSDQLTIRTGGDKREHSRHHARIRTLRRSN